MQRSKKFTPTVLAAFLVACGGGSSNTTPNTAANAGQQPTVVSPGAIPEATPQNPSNDQTPSTPSTPTTPITPSAPSTDPIGTQPAPATPTDPVTPGTTPPAPANPPPPAFAYDETARFSMPSHITADAAGNLYVLDSSQRIRKISATGDVSTLPITLGDLTSGLEVDATGNLYSISSGTIHKITQGGSSTPLGPQLADRYAQYAMTIDPAGILYVSHTNAPNPGSVIRKIAQDGSVTTVFSGTQVPFNNGLARDNAGNLYSEGWNGSAYTIFKIPVSGEPTEHAHIQGNVEIKDIALDAAGNLYVSRAIISRPSPGYCSSTGVCESTVKSTAIDKVTPDGTVTTIVNFTEEGSGSMTANQMGIAKITAGPDGNLYAAYHINNAIYKITPSGAMTLIAGKPGEAGTSD